MVAQSVHELHNLVQDLGLSDVLDLYGARSAIHENIFDTIELSAEVLDCY